MTDMDTPWEYASGLAGIGSSISYLISNGFIEADENEILSDFDALFVQNVYYGKHLDITRNTGIIGIGCYFQNRISNKSDDDAIGVQLKYVLLLIQDILFALLGMEGYTYPFAHKKTISAQEIKDCKRFLLKMTQTGLCPELTSKALSIVDKLASNEEDVLIMLEQLTPYDTPDVKIPYLQQLSQKHDNPIVKQLAELHLQDLSLPPWWVLF